MRSQLEQVWRLAGGHPRSLEYLDALLSGGTARYPDVTARLDAAITPPAQRRRPRPSGWPPAPGWMPRWPRPWRWPPMTSCSMTCWPAWPRFRGRRTCCWGCRSTGSRSTATRCCSRPGSPTRTPRTSPTGSAAYQQITGILAAAGITVDDSFDLAGVPGQCPGAAGAAPCRAEPAASAAVPAGPGPGRSRSPPARRPACSPSAATREEPWFFVHRWTATELADAGRPRARPAAGRGPPAGRRLLAMAYPGVAAGPGSRRA